jgi:hypothetical protein
MKEETLTKAEIQVVFEEQYVNPYQMVSVVEAKDFNGFIACTSDGGEYASKDYASKLEAETMRQRLINTIP